MFDFPFGMYALVWLYLRCTALTAAVAAQHFWDEDEFCQNLNVKYANQSLASSVTGVNVSSIHFIYMVVIY